MAITRAPTADGAVPRLGSRGRDWYDLSASCRSWIAAKDAHKLETRAEQPTTDQNPSIPGPNDMMAKLNNIPPRR